MISDWVSLISCLSFDTIGDLAYPSAVCETGNIGKFLVVIFGYGNVASFGGKFGYGSVTSSLGMILSLSAMYANALVFIDLGEYSCK